MPTLHDVQRSFARSVLFAEDTDVAPLVLVNGIATEDRLRIYRNTSRDVLTDALRLTYPAVDALVGEDFFAMAVARFLRAAPPRSGFLNDYGAEFGDFLGAMPEAAGVPYLADVARFEWALNVAANAPDAAPLDPAALSALAPEDQDRIVLTAHPSAVLLRLDTPADHIADAVLARDDAAMAAIDPVAGPVSVLIHRGPAGVAAQRIDPVEFEFLTRLFAGTPLGTLMDDSARAGCDLARVLSKLFSHEQIASFRLGDAVGTGTETP